ncbi:MAG: hypothetical protein ATN36_06255 [Epulopiscium sp. Nele67-Bin005]|nr:MAG: hypothetical protein ATN36_06255 [Epulopiscium sp. Nele67-Bin005]
MKLDIQALVDSPEMTFDETTEVNLKGLKLGTQQTICTTKVYGKVSKHKPLYLVNGFVDTTLKLLCNRCGQEEDYPLHAELYGEFSTDEIYQNENEDVKQVIGSTIDLSDDILASIALDIPLGFYCKEDCLGICSECGANQNENPCDCVNSDIDIRLEQFRDILRFTSK